MRRILVTSLAIFFVIQATIFGTVKLHAQVTGAPASPDWLIDPAPYKAKVEVSSDSKQIELSNGLIRRLFRLSPNAATVALDHLGTQQSLIRAVRPEAKITIDGTTFSVGGLVGQPNHAFLTPQWLDELENDPKTMQFVGYQIGKPLERFAWKRSRHHDTNANWPPPGVTLALEFALPSYDPTAMASEAGRDLLFSDNFNDLDSTWELKQSDRSERISFQNEGKPGEIYALSNTHCFATRSLPNGTSIIEADIDPGTDRDSSWGPGLALLLPNRVIDVNLRPGDRGLHGNFELRDNGQSGLATIPELCSEDGGLDAGRVYRLRARIESKKIIWEVADANAKKLVFHKLFETPHDGTSPSHMRVGKTDRQGGAGDEANNQDENWYRSKIVAVRCYGPLDAQKLKSVAQPSQAIKVIVNYEIYDGLPCYCKWLDVINLSDKPIRIDSFTSEILAAVEYSSEVDELSTAGRTTPNFHIETDMAFGGMMATGANRRSFRWLPDPDFHTQVNYEKKTPCLLEVGPDLGPAIELKPQETFHSYRSWILPQDSTDRERKGLAVRRLYRHVAPWTTENPLMMHLIASDDNSVKRAIDQCAEVGFEMLIMSFGSGFNVENRQPENIAKAKAFSDYARSKNIEIGSYSLLASRRISDEHDVVMPAGLKPVFGNSPCLQSTWGQAYFQQLYDFYRSSGFTLLEHDGSYPGDPCASEKHPGHAHLEDSRWRQWELISTFYQWARSEGIYLNVPDHYFMSGSNKTGMGYREVNWSLPRAHQVIHTRQNIFDGTWEKLPSMGWMFVPLTQYHGGGAAATIEPLSEHLDHYGRMLDSNLALGVQACYRGPRLFDSEATKALVKEKVSWYKKYRGILESDLIHGRRADARDIDWMLHVNPQLAQCGMLIVFNPLTTEQSRKLTIPLYYTGLADSAKVITPNGTASVQKLKRDYSIDVTITVPAEGMTWLVFEKP